MVTQGQTGGVSSVAWVDRWAVLLVGEEQIPVEAELGVFTPAVKLEWGGLLRGAPLRLATAIRQHDDVRLRFPGEEERRIHPMGRPVPDPQGRLVVFFQGEGMAPAV